MRRVWHLVTMVLLFLLPWQTRFIFGFIPLAGMETSFGILSIHVLEVLIVCACFVTFFLYRREALWLLRDLRKPTLFFMGALVIGALFSEMPILAWHHILHITAAGALFMLIALQPSWIKQFSLAFAAGLVFPVLLGGFQFAAGFSPASTVLGLADRLAERPGDAVFLFEGTRVLRAYGSFPHPNIFGGYLSVALLLLVGLWRAFSVREKRGALMLLLLLGVGLALTLSKSAFLGTVIALGLGFGLRAPGALQGWRKWGSALTAFVGVAVTAAFFFTLRFSANALETHSFTERIAQWQAYPVLLQHLTPLQWLLGIGGGTYPFFWQSINTQLDWWLYQPIHNVPALAFFEIGVLGCAALMWFLYRIDQRNFAALPRPEAVAALMAGASLFVIALFDHYLWTFWPGLALAGFVLGVAWASGNLANKS